MLSAWVAESATGRSVTVTGKAWVSSVSGVPVMRPSAAIASWLGRTPLVTAKAYGGTPPVATTRWS